MSSLNPFPASAGLKKPVCVFCGSSPGSSSIYAKATQAVGEALAKENIPIVYGVVSQSSLDKGGYVHGILPRALQTRASEATPAPASRSDEVRSGAEIVPGEAVKSKEGLGKDLLEDDYDGRLSMEVVGSMHERKLKMAQLATGGFVVLPGGYGTFEEMLEMITWNQLGIHRLPVLVLNIGNLFTPMMQLFQNSVDAGFIKPENLSLLKVVDLEGGAQANGDEDRAADWGVAALKAFKEWSFAAEAGYGIDWKNDDLVGPEPISRSENDDFSLFTTMRCFLPDPKEPDPNFTEPMPLLFDAHVDRLWRAHAHFSKLDPQKWGDFPDDDAFEDALEAKLEEFKVTRVTDVRVRMLLHAGPGIEVQAFPAPENVGTFHFYFDEPRPARRRPMILDPESYSPASEMQDQKDKRLYKTTDRRIYDEAAARGGKLYPDVGHPEVLLHTATHLLESTTSNIALYMPKPGQKEPHWITPRLHEKARPFLDGIMRQNLLDQGLIREGDVTVEDWKRVKAENGRVIGFNGLRGIWEAEPL